MNKDTKSYFPILEKYAQKNKQFTTNDAASVTGLPVLETEYSIKEMMEKYDCKLKVTENGDLIYDFGPHLKRRDAKSFAEHFGQFLDLLWRGFTIFYKFMISAFLVVYFVVFLVIVIGVVLTVMFGNKNDNSSKGAGNLIYLMFRIFWSIFEWNTIMGYNRTYRKKDRYGYNYKHYQEKEGVLAAFSKKDGDSADKKGFVASVYDFVFGPPRVQISPLANMQELASFLRENKGLVCTYEIQALAGWSRDDAKNFMTNALANFNGKAEISDQAVLYGDFTELIRRKDKKQGAPIIYYWDEYEPEHELTGNKSVMDLGIFAMNAFNLILSSLVIWGPLAIAGSASLFFSIFLGWFPFAYSMIFFAIPALRWLLLIPKRRKQHLLNIRKRLMMAIFQEQSAVFTLNQLTEIANSQHPKEEKLNPKLVQNVMMDVILDLEGDSFVNNNGEVVYKFENLDIELDEIEKLRNEKKNDSNLGEIVFES